MYPTYAKWVQSHRDLPIKLNQWCNIVVSIPFENISDLGLAISYKNICKVIGFAFTKIVQVSFDLSIYKQFRGDGFQCVP